MVRKIIHSIAILLIAGIGFVTPTYGSEKPSMLLVCNVKAENFPGTKNKLYHKEVTLQGSQLTDLGKKKVMDLGDYQLWAETYMMNLTGKAQIIDYVLIIRNTKTNMASIAHSGIHPLNHELMTAKVRQVVYDGKKVTGFIDFGCESMDIPKKPVFKTFKP